jgi:hypothetical protein
MHADFSGISPESASFRTLEHHGGTNVERVEEEQERDPNEDEYVGRIAASISKVE